MLMLVAFIASFLAEKLFLTSVILEIILGSCLTLFGVNIDSSIVLFSAIGALMITFLSGIECNFIQLKSNIKGVIILGIISFIIPFIAFVMLFHFVDWHYQSSVLSAAALAETSIAMVYSIVVGKGYIKFYEGKFIFGVMFVTDIIVLAIVTFLFSDANHIDIFKFGLISSLVLLLFYFGQKVLLQATNFSQSGERFMILVLIGLAFSSSYLDCFPILFIFIFSMIISNNVKKSEVARNLKIMSLSIFIPFYFIRAGMLVDFNAIVLNLWLIICIVIIKVLSKFTSSWMILKTMKFTSRQSLFICLMLATGLTFGTFIAIFGLEKGILDVGQYSILIASVIITSIVPSFLAQIVYKIK